MNAFQTKVEQLKGILSGMGSVLVAYSGGTDSTLLLKVASDVLKDKVSAVTADSEIHPPGQLEEARKCAKMIGVKHTIIATNELGDEDFTSNSPERCYYCKKGRFSKLSELAKENGLNYVIDGSNYDDVTDFRPGMRAATELGVRSPLKEAMLTKKEIRAVSKKLGLPTWDKPSSPCLATRFPYGSKITKKKLLRVKHAEERLTELGIKQLRVRDHGDTARIEVHGADTRIFLNEHVARRIVEALKELGYTYISLDLEGYRTGSMNESLKRKGESWIEKRLEDS